MQYKQLSNTRTMKILELVHIDLMGSVHIRSVHGKWYIFFWLITFLVIRGSCSLEKNMSQLRASNFLHCSWSQKKVTLFRSEVIMEENFIMKYLKIYVKNMESDIKTQRQKHHIRILLRKERKWHYMIWLEPCCNGNNVPTRL